MQEVEEEYDTVEVEAKEEEKGQGQEDDKPLLRQEEIEQRSINNDLDGSLINDACHDNSMSKLKHQNLFAFDGSA